MRIPYFCPSLACRKPLLACRSLPTKLLKGSPAWQVKRWDTDPKARAHSMMLEIRCSSTEWETPKLFKFQFFYLLFVFSLCGDISKKCVVHLAVLQPEFFHSCLQSESIPHNNQFPAVGRSETFQNLTRLSSIVKHSRPIPGLRRVILS